MEDTKNRGYTHYLAMDWSINGVEIASLQYNSIKAEVTSMSSEISEIKKYLEGKRGKKILTIEETTGSHWLYVELKSYVDKIIICDPYRNRLLSEGAKNDKIDAKKLCLLLRGGLLKEVYHNSEFDYNLRKLVSSYEDLVKAGVRMKNQKSAFERSKGTNVETDKRAEINEFIYSRQKRTIEQYEEDKKSYQSYFREISKKIPMIQKLEKVPGIGIISAVIIYTTVIDGNRFENKYKYWGYCGLVFHQKESGNRNYGRRRPRFSRKLKSVYKTATLAVIGSKTDINEYYEELLSKGDSFQKARNKVTRYIAKVTYSMLKHDSEYRQYQWKELKAA